MARTLRVRGDDTIMIEEDITMQNDDLEYEEFHCLTEKEELELMKMLREFNAKIQSAESFIQNLSSKLQELDGKNVRCVLASEIKVNQLMDRLETAEIESERVEKRQIVYDSTVHQIKDIIESMGEKNAIIGLANENSFKLQTELEELFMKIDIPVEYQAVLSNPDLTSSNGLKRSIKAGQLLIMALNIDLDKRIERLSAVQEQIRKMKKWKLKFSQGITRHLNNLFIHLVNESEIEPVSRNDLQLMSHDFIHKELTPYSELMCWLKAMDFSAYEGLVKVRFTLKRVILHDFYQRIFAGKT